MCPCACTTPRTRPSWGTAGMGVYWGRDGSSTDRECLESFPPFRTKQEQQHLEGTIVWVLVGRKGRLKLKNTRSPAILLRETNRNTRWRCRKLGVNPRFWSSRQWEREKWAKKRENSRINMKGWEGGDGMEKRPEEKAQLYSAVKQATSTSEHKHLSISFKACLKKTAAVAMCCTFKFKFRKYPAKATDISTFLKYLWKQRFSHLRGITEGSDAKLDPCWTLI